MRSGDFVIVNDGYFLFDGDGVLGIECPLDMFRMFANMIVII